MKVQKKIKIELTNSHPQEQVSLNSYRKMIREIILAEKISVNFVHIITVEDEYLRSLHHQFLNRDSYTDVMTFCMEEAGEMEAEIYISVDRAAQNAREYGVELREEIARLIIHGLLHVMGYNDKSHSEKQQMHELQELLLDKYLKSKSVLD